MASVAMAILGGSICGYLTITVCESFFHRNIQHAGPRLRRWLPELGRVGSALRDAWYSHHVIHHFQTFRRDHVTQFSDDDERERLIRRLREQGRDDVVDCAFGTELGSEIRNYLLYMAPTLPIFATVCWLGGAWFTLGACLPLIVWPLLAQFVHPYLHRRNADVGKDRRALIRFMARTRYFRYLARHHWLHHRYTDCNYNLLLGGDWLLGVHRRASADDLAAMHAIGIWVPRNRERPKLASLRNERVINGEH
jgi:hypothetical protein